MDENRQNLRSGPIAPSAVRFIKLGEGGGQEARCLAENLIRVEFRAVSHELALSGDRAAIREVYLAEGRVAQTASSFANQILDFYDQDERALWVTFIDGHLWWAFANRDVIPDRDLDGQEYVGARYRRVPGAWRNDSLGGTPLLLQDLSGRLTQMSGFRGAMCDVKESEYLIRRINDDEEPAIIDARAARAGLLEAIRSLATLLTWQDFELLVDLAFAQSGWRRTGETGGTQKTVDLMLELPSTGETAFVQVKSKTNQKQLDEYLARFGRRDEARMFYVYHTGPDKLEMDNHRCTLVGPQKLSEMILQAGLFDWLLKKVQ